MSVITIPKALREKPGDDGVDALITVINDVGLSNRIDLATKSDLKELKQELRHELRQELASKADLAAVKAELEIKIESVKSDILKWVFVFWVSQIGIIIAALKYFIK